MLITLLVAATLTASDPPPVVAPPTHLDPWYKKCVMLGSLPIASSDKTPDAALFEAHRLAKIMLAYRPEIIEAMAKANVRVAIMAEAEQTLDVPEHRDLQTAFPHTDWNKRARGLGATKARPAISAAEENLLRKATDRYRGESIFIHELSHAVMEMAMPSLDATFTNRVRAAYTAAKNAKKWEKTYAAANAAEYWAEGSQIYFTANRTATPADGVHNEIDTPAELQAYDRPLYDLLKEVYGPPSYSWRDDQPH